MKNLRQDYNECEVRFSHQSHLQLRNLICIMSFLCIAVQSAGQTYTYDVKLGSKKIGTMELFCKISGSSREFQMKSSFKTLLTSGKCMMGNMYVKNKLKSAYSYNYSRDELVEKTTTELINVTDYLVTQTSKKTKTEDVASINPGQLTILSLYLQEPMNMTNVYSERFGVLCPVKKVGAGQYVVFTPDGRTSKYFYTGNTCKEMQTKIGGIKITIILKSTI
ncbi:DUF6134 family protein [Dyadobacter sandarakinus]|uniref:GLPGLI family protein n=1 Tax=Dyadobacter sandarakinus TaxID=2747268 RepID=A0ABX7I4P6_9BACT|nr:DUF6134 family protein [Dyadobacter sandarakinus]QRR01059.1 hypothetical protein HWI92_09165 [Dyadobacter sandarakinus]